MTKSIVIIDMLNDFVTGGLKCDRAQRIIPRIKKLVAAAHASGIPVVFSNDAHRPQGDREFEIWGPHAIAGTAGAQVISELRPTGGDYQVPKRRYSGFEGAELLPEHRLSALLVSRGCLLREGGAVVDAAARALTAVEDPIRLVVVEDAELGRVLVTVKVFEHEHRGK